MEKDITKKSCLSDRTRYADLLNGLIFKGKQIVHAEDLTDMDSQSGMWSKRYAKGLWKHEQKYRDLIKKAAMGVGFVVIAVENQDEVNYLMSLRSMSYDTAEYERQAAELRKEVQKREGLSRAEFLSGFTEDSKLMPCMTLVLYYGKDWTGSLDLHGILDMGSVPEELRSYINNYFINLVEVRKIENMDVFQTDLKHVFNFIKYSEDKKKLRELVEKEPAYQEMNEEAYYMAAAYTNAGELLDIKKYQEGDKVNMCKAIQDMIEDATQEGMQIGIQRGLETGRLEGLETGRLEGIINTIEICKELGLPKQEIQLRVLQKWDIPEDKIQECIEKYWKQ